jgi:hypothetical protein
MERSHKAVSLTGLAAVVVLGASAASAQQAQPAPQTDVSRPAGTLSDKLGATNGVIHPEGTVDPSMDKGAPDTGNTPVIPPAGTPGGPTNAQPK